MPVHNEIYGGTRENKSPLLDALWLTLVKEAIPFQLGKYFSLSKKVLKKVLPKVVKESMPTFGNNFDNKIRCLRVLLNLFMNTCNSDKKRESLKFMLSIHLPKI